MAVEIVGRDEELGALDGFLGRKAAPGPAALVLEGEAGIGKSTLWLAGVERRGSTGCVSCPPGLPRSSSASRMPGLGDLLEDALVDVRPSCRRPAARALEVALLIRDEHGAGRLPNARRCRPDGAAPSRRA